MTSSKREKGINERSTMNYVAIVMMREDVGRGREEAFIVRFTIRLQHVD
jgi:hypothetical protein